LRQTNGGPVVGLQKEQIPLTFPSSLSHYLEQRSPKNSSNLPNSVTFPSGWRCTKQKAGSHSAKTACSSAMFGQTASNRYVVCGTKAVTYTRSAKKKGNSASTPTCCNCRLVEGNKPHPANYRGCIYAKEKQQKRKTHRTRRNTTGNVFPSNVITTGISLAAALRGGAKQQQQYPQRNPAPVASAPAAGKQAVSAPALQKETGQ
jgi:hypothetical protein